MKVLTVTMEGFGPYRDAQVVDFTTFTDDIFVITGKTGAGKSTILDAIVFALYDAVPRYDGTAMSVRSDFCGPHDPTVVTLEFIAGQDRYRVQRSPEYERPKKRGAGLTRQSAEATLWVSRGDDWEALAVRPVDVGQQISALMRLSARQFLQVVMLAQGRFQEFLRADTSARLGLLRSLFDTGRFEALEQRLRQVARERAVAVQTATTALTDLVDRAAAEVGVEPPSADAWDQWWARTAAELQRAADAATTAVVQAGHAADAARQAAADAHRAWEVRQRWEAARQQVAVLEARQDDHDRDVSRLALARLARPTLTPLRDHQAAQMAATATQTDRAAVIDAVEASTGLALAWPSGHGDLNLATVSALRQRRSELTGMRGALAPSVEAEASLAAKESAVTAADDAVARAGAAQARAKAMVQELPDKERAVRDERARVGEVAARSRGLSEDLERAEAAIAAHDAAASLSERLSQAREAEAEASAVHTEAVTAYNLLVQRRLASQAAHLAQALADDRPCPVCGSLTHPHPAPADDDHVTDDEVDAARSVADRTRAALTSCSDAAGDVLTELTAARERTGGRDRDQADVALKDAREAYQAALEATSRRDELDVELARLDTLTTQVNADLEQRNQDDAQARAALAVATADLTTTRELASQHPPDYDSVRDYAADLTRAADMLDEVALTTEVADSAEQEATRAKAAWLASLAESGFTTGEAVTAAVVEPAEMAQLETSIAEFEHTLAAAHAVVAELGSDIEAHRAADSPDESLDYLDERADTAATSRDEAIAVATRIQEQRARVTGLRSRFNAEAAGNATAVASRDSALTLADSLEGRPPNERRMRLESFVLAAQLEQVVAAANTRLLAMTSGQFSLEHDDERQYRNTQTGLGLRIWDAHTGQARTTSSLSGGETFLASLALALGLAETVTAAAGGIRLDTLFIDEGFGSLDAQTLEIAMATLDDLRSGGRTIGLISHVEAMHEQIPAQLIVEKMTDGSSRVVHAGTT